MHFLSRAAWLSESTAVEACQCESRLPGVPHAHSRFRCAGNSFVPQPGAEIPGMHNVSYSDSRVEFRPLLLQAIESEADDAEIMEDMAEQFLHSVSDVVGH